MIKIDSNSGMSKSLSLNSLSIQQTDDNSILISTKSHEKSSEIIVNINRRKSILPTADRPKNEQNPEWVIIITRIRVLKILMLPSVPTKIAIVTVLSLDNFDRQNRIIDNNVGDNQTDDAFYNVSKRIIETSEQENDKDNKSNFEQETNEDNFDDLILQSFIPFSG